MRLILALALLMAPALGPSAAQAAGLSGKSLDGYRTSCVRRCVEKHDQATCQRACGCMSNEMKRHWTQESFDKYAATLEKNPNEPGTRHMLQQLAAYCYQKARGG
jgi:hypothetical protein